MQYIGTLMRSVDADPIAQALLEIEQGAYRQAKGFHRIESWRDQLVDGNDDAILEITEPENKVDPDGNGHNGS